MSLPGTKTARGTTPPGYIGKVHVRTSTPQIRGNKLTHAAPCSYVVVLHAARTPVTSLVPGPRLPPRDIKNQPLRVPFLSSCDPRFGRGRFPCFSSLLFFSSPSISSFVHFSTLDVAYASLFKSSAGDWLRGSCTGARLFPLPLGKIFPAD